MNEIMVGELSEFAEGGYRVLRVDSFEFGIFREGDRLVAYENHCPHDGGPACQGKVIPRVEEELAPFGDRPVNATEAVTAICAIMRAADLNFFDLQMWYRRGERE